MASQELTQIHFKSMLESFDWRTRDGSPVDTPFGDQF